MKDDIWFVRWGNLNPVKHKEAREGDTDERWFHTAPKVYGIYAFPRGYIELFLISGSFGKHHRKYLRDEAGNKISYKDFYVENKDHTLTETIKPEYKKLLKKYGIKERDIRIEDDDDEDDILEKTIYYIVYNTKPKKFKYKGDIWHHLGCYNDKNEIIEQIGCWYKTSYRSYLKALHKADTVDRFDSYMLTDKVNRHGNPHTYPNHDYKDKYEVFIEKVK